ncbi:MAG: bifunctional DNA primase/polymerase [Thermogemmatispora sp.]|uniref:bifunctional DNA primase/polymerase n=1 Tax=Thermogemmatispora sp. TaxID=1968838 RepID=UPI0019E58CF6|nr:bifunctional DNA primase/polymerase [Thermogemmatispora sp.]MBE3568401.1 bifunctional DNA primase/polymerase [Thermogemmatispora sp.]
MSETVMPYSPASRSADASPVLQTALTALEAGISVVPIRPDGTKQPALTHWKRWQTIRPTVAEVEAWFRDPRRGLALVTGRVSGHLIALDFDDEAAFLAWMARLRQDQRLHILYEEIACGYEERTPKGGRHLLLRCLPRSSIGRSQVLARSHQGDVLVETREEGAIIIVAPSAGSVHPTGRPYILLRGGVDSIRTIDPAQLEEIFHSLRVLDKRGAPNCTQPSILPTAGPRGPLQLAENRPGDLFNRDPQVTWESILLPKGWELVRTVGREGYWRHPGKRGPHYSATTNHEGDGKLHVFSTSAPLPPGSYTRFAAYALLYHGGNFQAAAKALKQRYRSFPPAE